MVIGTCKCFSLDNFSVVKNIRVSRVKSNIIRWHTKSSNVSLNIFLVSSNRDLLTALGFWLPFKYSASYLRFYQTQIVKARVY